MIKLLLIADDFTGALDTGVQFASAGTDAKIITYQEGLEINFKDESADILVIDLETRHLPPEKAYELVTTVVRNAMDANISHIFKKTDSALRGNIGVELQALLEVSGEKVLPFIPALPSMNRITKNGIHYVDGIPIKNSVFGKDPFDPVTSSYVKDLFQMCNVKVVNLQKNDRVENTDKPSIFIYDAESIEDCEIIINSLMEKKQCRILAGCSGLAAVLAKHLDISKRNEKIPKLYSPLLIVCGSLNPISRKQVEFAGRNGIQKKTIINTCNIGKGYIKTIEGQAFLKQVTKKLSVKEVLIIDTEEISDGPETFEVEDIEQKRMNISNTLGELVKAVLLKKLCNVVMIIGGDTLLGFVKQSDCTEIKIYGELSPGTVLSSMQLKGNTIWVISKSGGFGEESLLMNIVEELHGDGVKNGE